MPIRTPVELWLKSYTIVFLNVNAAPCVIGCEGEPGQAGVVVPGGGSQAAIPDAVTVIRIAK
ncbi:hypothetical protein E2C01_042773 [Portunus trituberculatus]|uniref:Uncharacterized protein n=1 Tax=Portunus trituberculatus TaxID=210409 RepID=A0A5B7FTX1_PORTR|nr:hypothetical protein [Portunus trituberculatus]